MVIYLRIYPNTGEPQCRRNPLGKQEKKRFGAVNSRPDNDKTISNTLIKKELVSDRTIFQKEQISWRN